MKAATIISQIFNYFVLPSLRGRPTVNMIALGCKPDPFDCKIKSIEHVNGNTIVMANYGGATFGGDKLILLRGKHKQFRCLDPHFISTDYSVIGRFIPTEEGLNMARASAKIV